MGTCFRRIGCWCALCAAAVPAVSLGGGVGADAAAFGLEEVGGVDLCAADVSSGAAGWVSRQVRWGLAGGAFALDAGLSGGGPQVRRGDAALDAGRCAVG